MISGHSGRLHHFCGEGEYVGIVFTVGVFDSCGGEDLAKVIGRVHDQHNLGDGAVFTVHACCQSLQDGRHAIRVKGCYSYSGFSCAGTLSSSACQSAAHAQRLAIAVAVYHSQFKACCNRFGQDGADVPVKGQAGAKVKHRLAYRDEGRQLFSGQAG